MAAAPSFVCDLCVLFVVLFFGSSVVWSAFEGYLQAIATNHQQLCSFLEVPFGSHALLQGCFSPSKSQKNATARDGSHEMLNTAGVTAHASTTKGGQARGACQQQQ